MNVYRMQREEGCRVRARHCPKEPDALPCQPERVHWQGQAGTGTPQPGPGSQMNQPSSMDVTQRERPVGQVSPGFWALGSGMTIHL